MPKLTIENINYIVAGKYEKIINVDIYDSDLGMHKKNVSLFTESDTVDMDQLPAGQGRSSIHLGTAGLTRNINAHGFRFMDSDGKVAYALFDAKDIALKSMVAKRIEKAYDLSSYQSVGLDMYFPHLLKNPLGFVQLKEYSYGMTDSTPVAPVLKSTTLSEQRKNIVSSAIESYSAKPEWNSYLNPYDKFGSGPYDPGMLENLLPIYTYTPKANLSSIVFRLLSSEYDNREELSKKIVEASDSYASFRDFICEKYKSASMLSVLFKPVYNFQNIEHNYIVEVPVDIPGMSDNDYERGTVYADMIMGKNVYDDIYDMNVSSVGDFGRARQYSSINQTGNGLFLTYFDDVQYSADKEKKKSFDHTYENKTEDITEEKLGKPQYRDYAKIEKIDAINRFISLTNHKANLFSAKVYGLQNVLNTRPDILSGNDIAANIKTNIENSIRRIVTNFVPAHTQYFGVVADRNTGEWFQTMDDSGKTTEHC